MSRDTSLTMQAITTRQETCSRHIANIGRCRNTCVSLSLGWVREDRIPWLIAAVRMQQSQNCILQSMLP